MQDLRIGLLLGIRQIQRASLWTTLLIIAVILFTFINLVALSGILIGIIDSSLREVRTGALGDITISPLTGETQIKETERFLKTLPNHPEIATFSPRLTGLATIEANYQERRDLRDDADVITVMLTGIDPVAEDLTSGLSQMVSAGEYFSAGETGYILMGKLNIERYAAEFGDAFDSLKNVYPGDTVMITVDGQSREFTVKGIVDSKVDLISTAVYIPEREFRRLFNRTDHDANQIAVRLQPGFNEYTIRDRLRASELATLATINSFTEDIPKFLIDMRTTFNLLGLFTGAIGLVVASITIFIVIFINAISRRRQIGILKAIGISRRAIEYAYITQAAFYAITGAIIGILITQFIIIPYFEQNPINFPFANASLSISLDDMLLRSGALFAVTLIAGFIPAWMITRQNTLNAILGRR